MWPIRQRGLSGFPECFHRAFDWLTRVLLRHDICTTSFSKSPFQSPWPFPKCKTSQGALGIPSSPLPASSKVTKCSKLKNRHASQPIHSMNEGGWMHIASVSNHAAISICSDKLQQKPKRGLDAEWKAWTQKCWSSGECMPEYMWLSIAAPGHSLSELTSGHVVDHAKRHPLFHLLLYELVYAQNCGANPPHSPPVFPLYTAV